MKKKKEEMLEFNTSEMRSKETNYQHKIKSPFCA